MQFVDAPTTLEKAARALIGKERLYIDTEFESNRSGTRMCLLQVTGGDETFVIDTLRLGALEPLREAFEADGVEWVLHAGLQDVFLLMDRLRLNPPKRLFDTQVAWGLLSAESSVSLAYLQFRVLGIRSGKAHQADDWVRRPLAESQIEYAASDVEHLPAIRDALGERARGLDREEIILEASSETLFPEKEPPAPISLASFRNAWQLGVKNQAALRFVIDWYNGLSDEEREQAPESKALLSIASRLPESPDVLSRIKGIPRSFVRRVGPNFVRDLRRAAEAARHDDFTPIDPPPYATFEEIRLDAWFALARAEVCATLSVAPELALPGRVTKAMRKALVHAAASNPDSATQAAAEVLSGWRKRLVSETFAHFCQDHPPPL